MPPPSLLQRLKERKLVQWALAYLAGAWVLLEATAHFVEQFQWPDRLNLVVTILAGVGFFAVLVLAWINEPSPETQDRGDAAAATRRPQSDDKDRPSSPHLVPDRSIAVLPFADMSPGGDQEYFCDGLTEAIINTFTAFQDLKVVARTSAFSFKGKDVDVREIGSRLDVGHVLEGSVQTSGDRLRITAQLINVSDGYHLWSERFDRPVDDLFAIQDEISLAIAERLELKADRQEQRRLTRRPTDNREAYHHYLKGRHFYNRRTEEGFEKSIEQFELALKLDPEFALPYAGLADTYLAFGFYELAPMADSCRIAKENALRALEIDVSVGEAHTSLALIYGWHEYDWKSAHQAHLRALELSPSEVETHHHYGHFLTVEGRFEEAVAAMRKAIELEPLSVNLAGCLGQTFYLARRTDEAIAQLEDSIELDPSFPVQYWFLGKAYLQAGRMDDAIGVLEKAGASASTHTMAKSALGYAYGVRGDTERARAILDELQELSKGRTVDPVLVGIVHIGLGDRETALDWMDRGLEARSIHLPSIAFEWYFDPLRDHPRFVDLLERVGLAN